MGSSVMLHCSRVAVQRRPGSRAEGSQGSKELLGCVDMRGANDDLRQRSRVSARHGGRRRNDATRLNTH